MISRSDDINGRRYHPGAARALKRLAEQAAARRARKDAAEIAALNDFEIAQAVATARLPSGFRYLNSWYVQLRLSGTGVAYRASCKEYVFRDPDLWLSAEMQRRVLGLPIIIEHAPTEVMDSEYFGQSCVGVVVYSYATSDALFGVGRIIDEAAAKLILDGIFDTSPAVVLSSSTPSADVDIGDSDQLLVEGPPALLDHLALVYMGDGNKGVWSRDAGPGVITPASSETEIDAALAND